MVALECLPLQISTPLCSSEPLAPQSHFLLKTYGVLTDLHHEAFHISILSSERRGDESYHCASNEKADESHTAETQDNTHGLL